MQIIWIDICRADNGNSRGINGKKNSWHSSLLEQKKDEVEQAHSVRHSKAHNKKLSSRKVGK